MVQDIQFYNCTFSPWERSPLTSPIGGQYPPLPSPVLSGLLFWPIWASSRIPPSPGFQYNPMQRILAHCQRETAGPFLLPAFFWMPPILLTLLDASSPRLSKSSSRPFSSRRAIISHHLASSSKIWGERTMISLVLLPSLFPLPTAWKYMEGERASSCKTFNERQFKAQWSREWEKSHRARQFLIFQVQQLSPAFRGFLKLLTHTFLCLVVCIRSRQNSPIDSVDPSITGAIYSSYWFRAPPPVQSRQLGRL